MSNKKRKVNIYEDFTADETPETHRKEVFKEKKEDRAEFFRTKPSLPTITTVQCSSKPVQETDDPMGDFTERCYK